MWMMEEVEQDGRIEISTDCPSCKYTELTTICKHIHTQIYFIKTENQVSNQSIWFYIHIDERGTEMVGKTVLNH